MMHSYDTSVMFMDLNKMRSADWRAILRRFLLASRHDAVANEEVFSEKMPV